MGLFSGENRNDLYAIECGTNLRFGCAKIGFFAWWADQLIIPVAFLVEENVKRNFDGLHERALRNGEIF